MPLYDGIFNHNETLYNVTGKTATETGSTYEIVPVKGGVVHQGNQEIHAVVSYTTEGGASSPTMDATIETSVDGTSWYTWGGITQVTTNTSGVQQIYTTSKFFYRYVRAKLTLGGGTAPTTACKVDLVSNGKFKLVAS